MFRQKQPGETNREYQTRQWIHRAWEEFVEPRAIFEALPYFLIAQLDEDIEHLSNLLDNPPDRIEIPKAAALVALGPAALAYLPFVIGSQSYQVNCFQLSDSGAGSVAEQAQYFTRGCASYFERLERAVTKLKSTICEIEADLTFQGIEYSGSGGGVSLCEYGSSIAQGIQNAVAEREGVYQLDSPDWLKSPVLPLALILGGLLFVRYAK